MGCTSSSPPYANSSTQHANATERNETMEEKNENQGEVTKIPVSNEFNVDVASKSTDAVLPNSNIVDDPLDVVSFENEKLPEACWITGNRIMDVNHQKIDEQVVIDILLEEKRDAEERKKKEEDLLEALSKNTEQTLKSEGLVEDLYNQNSTKAMENLSDLEAKDLEHAESDVDDAISESSRTTRWEALADVAAELPPSLAVDPVTGQIYTFK